jgi:hypothetical protein
LKSLKEVIEKIQNFQQPLIQAALLPASVANYFSSLNLEKMTSEVASVFLLDFTPDNVFLSESEKVSFIDPWPQSTYLGSPAISMSQFFTLAHTIYKYSLPAETSQQIETFWTELQQLLELSDWQLQQHQLLGSILQLTLSAFVRIDSDPATAQKFAQMSEQQLKSLQSNT